MLLDTLLIPQADKLWDVARVPEAVQQGLTTPAAIGTYIGRKGPRQGLYYTQAARVLGLVNEDFSDDTLIVTSYGRMFIRYDRRSQRQGLRRLLRENEPTRSVLLALKARGGLNWDDVARVLQGLAPLAKSTAYRRARTAAAWLCTVGLASWGDGTLRYNELRQPVMMHRRN